MIKQRWIYVALAAFAVLTSNYVYIALVVAHALSENNLELLNDKLKSQGLNPNLTKAEADNVLMKAHEAALGLWRECSAMTSHLLQLTFINGLFIVIVFFLIRKKA